MGAETRKEGSWSCYEIDAGVVWSDFIFKRPLDPVEGSRNEKHNANETSGDAGGALGHTQSSVKSVGGAESSPKDSIWVDN